jgi:hypothetical protein
MGRKYGWLPMVFMALLWSSIVTYGQTIASGVVVDPGSASVGDCVIQLESQTGQVLQDAATSSSGQFGLRTVGNVQSPFFEQPTTALPALRIQFTFRTKF